MPDLRSISVSSRLPFFDKGLELTRSSGWFPFFLPRLVSDYDSLITITSRRGGTVFALGGNDTVIGSAATDLIDGGVGDDHLEGGGGADILRGGAGNDVILVRRPEDHPLLELVNGGSGYDTLLFEGPGSFTVSPLTKAVELFKLGNKDGTTATDDATLIGTLLSYGAEFEGNDGNNIILATTRQDQIRAGGGNDIALGLAGDDRLDGGEGFDLLLGDGLSAAELNDVLALAGSLLEGLDLGDLSSLLPLGGAASPAAASSSLGGFSLFGSLGSILESALDALSGSGNDTLDGGAGTDLLLGGGGNDLLQGGLDQDFLLGGSGNNQLDGGTGNSPGGIDLELDFAVYALAPGGVTIDLHAGSGSNGYGGSDTISNVEGVIGSLDDDVIKGDTSDLTVLVGLSGDDMLTAADKEAQTGLQLPNFNILVGGDGDDALMGGDGALNILTGDGFSIADVVSAAGSIPLIGGLVGGFIDDALGGALPPELGDLLNVGSGNDTLHGGDGLDLMLGGSGDDTIAGKGGADILTGGSGNDVFRYTSTGDGGSTPNLNPSTGFNLPFVGFVNTSAGTLTASLTLANVDRITDFSQGEDTIDLSELVSGLSFQGEFFTNAGSVTGNISNRLGEGNVGYTQLGGNTLLGANLTGTNDDFLIALEGTYDLSAADLVLA